MVSVPFKVDMELDWQMSPEERVALIDTLSKTRPEVAIEIGTFKGGSLQAVQAFAKETYSIDINDEPRLRLGAKFPNVHFLVGSSTKVLPELLDKLDSENKKLGVILVDGDHSKKGVQTDLHTILSYPHKHPLTILAHDCFNPQCRSGILSLDYTKYNSVQAVEIDYVLGNKVKVRGLTELWGGFAKISIDPANSGNGLNFINRHQKEYDQAYRQSSHPFADRMSFLTPIKSMIRKWLGR